MSTRQRLAAATALFLARTASADEPCRPVARLSGDPAHTQAVLLALGERGVDAVGTSRCGVVAVRVEPAGSRLRLSLTDAGGRQLEREADDATVAATIIESWVRDDVSAPLLAPRPAPAMVPVLAVEAPRGPAFALGVAGRVGAGSDGSTWLGARAHACARAGWFCLGVVAHLGVDSGASGDAGELDSERRELGLLLAVDRPFGLGPSWRLRPGLAAGLMSFTSTRDGDEEEPASLAVEAHAALTWPLAGAWNLELDLALAALPLVDERFTDDEDGVVIAGAPAVRLWLGLGLSHGGW
jgi:hypothetical protein